MIHLAQNRGQWRTILLRYENYEYMNSSKLPDKLTDSAPRSYLRPVTVICYVLGFDVDRKFHDSCISLNQRVVPEFVLS
jgi:hypothetical protein